MASYNDLMQEDLCCFFAGKRPEISFCPLAQTSYNVVVEADRREGAGHAQEHLCAEAGKRKRRGRRERKGCRRLVSKRRTLEDVKEICN